MRQFLINNKVLVGFLVFTLLGAICLIYLFMTANNSVLESMDKINAAREQMNKIERKREPNPVKANIAMIESDTALFKKTNFDLSHRFGQPYRNALRTFLADLASKTPLKDVVPEDSAVEDDEHPVPADASESTDKIADAEVVPVKNKTAESTDKIADAEVVPVKNKTAETEVADVKTPPVESKTEDVKVDATPAESPKATASVEKQVEPVSTPDRTDTPPPAPEKTVAPAVRQTAKNNVELLYDEEDFLKLFDQVYASFYQNRKVNVESSAIEKERLELFNRFRDKVIEAPSSLPKDQAAQYVVDAGEKFDKAFEIFRANVQKLTQFEKLSSDDAKMIFMDSLGLPRTMGRFECKSYIDGMYRRIYDRKLIPGIPYEGRDYKKIRDYTYDLGGRYPPEDVIPWILLRVQILEDIFTRLRDAGVRNLASIKRPKTHLSGDSTRYPGYKVHSFSIQIEGSLQQIRAFVNRLHESYRDNRIYNIRRIVLENKASASEVASARSKLGSPTKAKENPVGALAVPVETVNPEPLFPNNSVPAAMTNDAEYGRVLIGNGETVSAEIEFDYYIFVGNAK